MSRIINGDTVVHFKGKMYNVISIDAEHTENGERYVCYRALYGENKTYIRPYDMFMSKVDKSKYPDVVAEYRMTVYCTEDVSMKSKKLSEVSIEDVLRVTQDGHILRLNSHQDSFGYAIFQGTLMALRETVNEEYLLSTEGSHITSIVVLNGEQINLPYAMNSEKLRDYIIRNISTAFRVLKTEPTIIPINFPVRVF